MAGASWAASAPDPRTIAFTRRTAPALDPGIYVVHSDGSGLKRLTTDAGHAAWSPDGTRIAYTAPDGLWVMNADGSGKRLVTEAIAANGLAWSPDGTRIVFSNTKRDVESLVVVNADGSGLRQVTPIGKPVTADEHPAWAPDGRIFFTRWKQKPAKELADGTIVPAEGDVPRWNILSIDPDGGGLKVVRSGPSPVTFALSPDGRWLVVWESESDRLVRIAADGRGERVVLLERARQKMGPEGAGFISVALSWSPDGKSIAFAGSSGGYLSPSPLYLIDADGSGLREVPNTGKVYDPVWQPQAPEPVSQWDAPGNATLEQAKAVAKLYPEVRALRKVLGLYAEDATWDYWPGEHWGKLEGHWPAPTSHHLKGAAAIEGVYADYPGRSSYWGLRTRPMVAPGVAVYEGSMQAEGPEAYGLVPGLALLAVDGDKIVHEEVFLDPSPPMKDPSTVYGPATDPRDTADTAARVARAVGYAFARGDRSALSALVAPGVLFYDMGQTHGVEGRGALLAWWDARPDVTFTNKEPIAGPGWAVLRWTVRGVSAAPAVDGAPVALPGATVIEVRDGKVVRMTLYYDSEVISLQE